MVYGGGVTVDALIRRLFVVIGVLVLGGVALWFVSYRGVYTSRELVQQTRIVQAQIQDIERSVLEAELEVRGVLSGPVGRPTAPGVAALDATDAGVRRLGELTRTDPGQHDRIRALTDQLATHRAAVEAELAATRTAPGDPGLVARDARIGAIRRALAEMLAEEGQVIELRRDTALARIRWMSIIGAIALAMLVLFAIAVAFVIRRQLAAQRVTAAAVQRSESFLVAVDREHPEHGVRQGRRASCGSSASTAPASSCSASSRDELIGKNDYDFFPADEAEFFQAKDRETLAGKQLVDIPEEPIETGGGQRWLHTKKVPILDDDGRRRTCSASPRTSPRRSSATEALREAKEAAEAATTRARGVQLLGRARPARAAARDRRLQPGAARGPRRQAADGRPAVAHLVRVRAAASAWPGSSTTCSRCPGSTRAELTRARVDLAAASRAIVERAARARIRAGTSRS